MAATSSDYLLVKQLDFLLKGTTFTSPANIYVALFTTAPALSGTGGNEISTGGTGYTRMPIAQNTGWSYNSSTLTYSNAVDITFPTPTGNWGTIVAAALYDASTGGNLLLVSPLATPKTVSLGDSSPKILANQLQITRAS